MSGKMVLFPDETHNLSDMSGNQAELPDECIIIGKRLTEKVNMTDQSASFLYIWLHWEDGRDCGGVSTRGHGQREGPDGDKWSKTTQETLGGSGESEANGVLRNPCHPPT